MKRISQKAIIQIIYQVKHPEINRTLAELGMIQKIAYVPQSNKVFLTLIVPFRETPQIICDQIVARIRRAVRALDVGLQVSWVEMSAAERYLFAIRAQPA